MLYNKQSYKIDFNVAEISSKCINIFHLIYCTVLLLNLYFCKTPQKSCFTKMICTFMIKECPKCCKHAPASKDYF